MGPHESLHGGGLPDAFVKLVAPDRAKEREIGLQHEAETVARFVDLALNRVLGEAQEIQVRQLGNLWMIPISGLPRYSAALRLPTLGYTVDSFAPAQLALRANLRLLYLAPAPALDSKNPAN
jgi:hypothetical protein